MMLVNQQDGKDKKIDNEVKIQPGITLSEIAMNTGLSVPVVKYRVWDAAVAGRLKIEKVRGRVRVYPVDYELNVAEAR